MAMIWKCAALILVIVLLACADETTTDKRTEAEFNDSLCDTVGGERETRQPYYIYGEAQKSYVSIDCETDTLVIEGGLDKRSSLDSLQQALFASIVAYKAPVVVIYDTDGRFGQYEHRIRTASRKAGVLFVRLRFDETMNSERLSIVLREPYDMAGTWTQNTDAECVGTIDEDFLLPHLLYSNNGPMTIEQNGNKLTFIFEDKQDMREELAIEGDTLVFLREEWPAGWIAGCDNCKWSELWYEGVLFTVLDDGRAIMVEEVYASQGHTTVCTNEWERQQTLN